MENDSALENQQVRFCPYCGQAVLQESDYCQNCGSNLIACAENSVSNSDMLQNAVVAMAETTDNYSGKKNSRELSIVGGGALC